MKSESSAIQQQLALIGHAASSPQRLRLLVLLAQGPKTVEQCGTALGESIANTSAHLKVLRSAGLVLRRQDGRFAHYSLASPTVEKFLVLLRELAEERLPELREVVRQFREEPDQLIAFDPSELLADVRSGRVTLLDVRPPEEFAQAHLPGAVSLPIDALRTGTPQTSGKVVVYCRGPYCIVAREAVDLLRRAGIDAWSLPVGVMEWRVAGHPLAAGAQPSTHP